MTKEKPIKDASGYEHYDHAQCKKLFNYLLENGIVILIPDTLHGGISYAHTKEDVRQLASTVRKYVTSRP
jgi:glutamate-1-semialdehyde aminotransferase